MTPPVHSAPPSAPQAASQPVVRQGIGIAAMIASVFVFSIMDTTVKWLGDGYPTSQIVFFRCFFALIPVLGFVYFSGGFSILRTRQPGVHLMRSMLGLAAMGLVFWSYSQLRLADAIAILFSAPILLTAFSVPLLGERVGLRRWCAVIVGFIGVMVIVNPSGGVFELAAFAALGGATCIALAMIVVRRLSATESPAAITFWFTVTCSAASALWVWVDGWVMPVDLFDWGLLISVGVMGAFAQYLMTFAFRHAEVALLAPMDYTAILWTTILGYWIWQEIPSMQVWIGAGIIIASGLYIVHRETRLSGTRPRKLPKLRARP